MVKPRPRKKYYEVALSLALKKHFIYSSECFFHRGQSVFVPLKNKQMPAVILREVACPKEKSFEIKSILSEDEERVRLSSARLRWLSWLADYYHYNFGQVVHLSFPPALRAGKKKYTRVKIKKSSSKIENQSIDEKALDFTTGEKPLLTSEQKKCLQEIEEIEEKGSKGFRVHLLHGVTGSGKTEVYFRLIEPAIKEGKSVLVLVPEIALTPQHIKRFSCRFPGKVACFHSGLSSKEKRFQWMEMVKGDKRILIGPRSALFCPLPRLSWIIVDEEHESYFKQEEKLKYHGRDAAVYLGKCLNIPVVLGSATPSLESWWNAQSGKYIYHQLKKRVFKTSVPAVEVVDMKKQRQGRNSLPYWLSKEMYEALKQSLEKNEQAALFLNRRGESVCVFCPSCGYHFSCVNCDISLTQHQSSHLLCHYCGFQQEKPVVCPECKGEDFFSFGVGTAALQRELQKLFPSVCIIRADRDEVRTHKQWAEMLDQIEKKEVDIVIGTQMIAKGLDFPHLNLVGLILADQGLNWPDFRSAEKSFQLITQMAGRSGRRNQPGRVILQTYNPSHPVIKSLRDGSYELFAEQELKQRKNFFYPPFGKLCLVRVQSVSASSAKKMALYIREQLKSVKDLEVLGPAPALHFRLRNKYRYHLLFKSSHPAVLKKAGATVLHLVSVFKIPAVQVHVNTDPVYMF